ncbi:MAG: type II secretion system protein [Candidatus Izemoplasmataceae bacterium]
MNQKGVTLIEILIVIVVLGIVSAVSLPSATNIFTSGQKDQVLTAAIELERAAKSYCREDNYISCPTGTVLTETEVASYTTLVDETYTVRITIGPTIRSVYVYYAKTGEFSFPFNEDGRKQYTILNGVSYLGKVPTSSSEDFVNEAFDASDLTMPAWSPNTFLVGDVFTYDGATWQVRTLDSIGSPPTLGVNLEVNGPYQEITPEYKAYNTYVTNDFVLFNSKRFKAINDSMSGIEPESQVGWQEITPLWRDYNVYEIGDIVYHNDATFEAVLENMTGIEPSTTAGWQELTDNWRVFNFYYKGDRITYEADGLRYGALTDISPYSGAPDVNLNWLEITEGIWQAGMVYYEGEIVEYDGLLYQSLIDFNEEVPSISSNWLLIS